MSFSPAHLMPRRLTGVFLFFIAFTPALLGAQALTFRPIRPSVVSARTAGFGGAYSALEAGFDTLATNPAALAYVKKEWSIASLSANIAGPLFDLPSVMQASDMATGVLDLVGANNGVYIGADITGPISFGKVDRNFGFGIFNRSLTSVDIPSITSATVVIGEEILFVGGYGLTVFEQGPHSVALGLQMKGFFQSFLVESGTALTVLDAIIKFDVNNLPTVLSTGFGVDMGLMYRYGSRFSAGLTCKDLYTPVFSTLYGNIGDFAKGNDIDTMYNRFAPNLSAGVVYSIPLPVSWTTITGWNVMFDYRDALDLLNPIYRNPILNVAAGTEMILLNVVSLRAGINETYLATGLGLDLTVCQLDFAIYGRELGIDPGKRPVLNMDLSLSFKY